MNQEDVRQFRKLKGEISPSVKAQLMGFLLTTDSFNEVKRVAEARQKVVSGENISTKLLRSVYSAIFNPEVTAEQARSIDCPICSAKSQQRCRKYSVGQGSFRSRQNHWERVEAYQKQISPWIT